MKKINLVVILLFSCIILMSSALAVRRHKSYQRDIFDADQDYFRDSSEGTYTEKKCKSGTALRSRRRNPFNRISGGRDAKEGEFPSFVSLGFGLSPYSLKSFCSGVAISETLILTAAHCYKTHFWPLKVWAAPGIHPPNEWRGQKEKVEAYEVVRFCLSPKFEQDDYGATRHDYQVLRVSKPMAGIEPAKLNSADLPVGFKAISVGAGIIDTTDNIQTAAERLQVLPVMHTECLDDDRDHSHICFRSYESDLAGDTCEGDSGGPIYGLARDQSQVVVGLTSYGQSGCKKGKNSISVNVHIANVKAEIKNLVKSCSAEE